MLLFKDQRVSGLFKMKFHLLDHLCEDFAKLHNIWSLDEAPYEHFYVSSKRAYRKSWMRKETGMKGTLEAMKPDPKELKENVGSINVWGPSTEKESRRQTLDVVGWFASNDEYCTSLEQVMKMFALRAGGCTTQDNLVLKRIPRYDSLDEVHNFAHFVRELCRKRDVLIEDSEISINIVSCAWISELEVQILPEFIE